MTNRCSLRDIVDSGEVSIGTFVGLGSILTAEICALSGFDWLLFDLEHGASDEFNLIGQLKASAAQGVATAVRVETADRVRCGRVLDLGAEGVMAPRLDTAEQALNFTQHLRYPPDGDRGVATYHSAAGFGLRSEYLESANDDMVGIVQIETPTALDRVVDIAAVHGVDVIFVGPRDLGASLRVEPSLDSPRFREALLAVVQAARGAGKSPGILAPNAAIAEKYSELGFKYIGVGSDSSFLAQGASQTVTSLSQASGR